MVPARRGGLLVGFGEKNTPERASFLLTQK